MVPSVRNKIAMLESRSAALREFTSPLVLVLLMRVRV